MKWDQRGFFYTNESDRAFHASVHKPGVAPIPTTDPKKSALENAKNNIKAQQDFDAAEKNRKAHVANVIDQHGTDNDQVRNERNIEKNNPAKPAQIPPGHSKDSWTEKLGSSGDDPPPKKDPITVKGSIYEYGASLKDTYKDLSDQAFINYLRYNPDLREYAEAQGLYGKQAADWGRAHWHLHGRKNDARINQPGQITDETWLTRDFDIPVIPKVYSDMGLKSRDEIFKWHLGQMTPSEMWDVRRELDPNWNLKNFQPEGWNYAQDIPYGEGLIGDTLALSHSLGQDKVGQLIDTKERRFLQDRFEDKFITNDFPSDWVTNNKWTGPPALKGYWDTLTGAVRDDQGILRAAWDRPYEGWGNFVAPEGFTVTRVGQGSGMAPSTLASSGPITNLHGLLDYSNQFLTTPYTRPELQDWSHIMPEAGRLRSQPQRAVVADQGALFQPFATGGLIEYAPVGKVT